MIVYFGICEYEEEPGVLLVSKDKFDAGDCVDPGLSEEIFSSMNTLPIEYVEEGLFGFYEGSAEELKISLEKLGFEHNEEVEKDAIESFE